MGHINVEVTLSNPEKPDLKEEMKALVDTGATFTVIPRDLARKLELRSLGGVTAKTASGIEEYEEAEAKVKVMGRERTTPVLISDKLDVALLGVVTLEVLRLKVDPTTSKVEELPLLLYTTLRSKSSK